MLSRIKEEHLQAIPVPVESRTLRDELSSARSHVLELISRHLVAFGDRFPAETCQNGGYPLTENVEWTTSFWTGQLWLAWEMSGETTFREMAEKHVRSFGLRIAGRNDTNTHDLGFLYTLSCVAAWRLTGNREARGFALLAAEALLERFHPKAKIIQAWGDLSDPEQAGRMIIDCNMNLPLLYWATEQTGDARFADAAKAHVMTMIVLSKRLANYFLNRLPEDYVCHWDLALLGTDALRDSSSAAIAVCGLLELVKQLPVTDPDRERYLDWAKGIMSSLTKHYLMGKDEKGNGLLKHAVYHLASNKGVDECASWGDYFYVEALVRFTQSWKPYW